MTKSREEAIAAGIKVSDTRHSMNRRKSWHDYRRQGSYMLTFVVEGRQPLLGKLKTATEPADKSAGTVAAASDGRKTAAVTATVERTALGTATAVTATVERTALGRAICDEEVRKINALYPMVEVWKLCIMPDHIHMIVRVKEDMPEGKHLGLVVRGFKAGCTKAWWKLQDEGRMPAVKTAGIVADVKTAGRAAATVPAVSTAGEAARPSLFEGGYCDKLLMNEGQLDTWKHYLDDNPRRLSVKRLHPDYFTIMQHITIGEWQCQMVGNRFLLDIPQKVAVIVHRAFSDEEYASRRKQWLACGEAGGVLVSAAIATREKSVMREAMDLGYHIIWVRENGFPPLYKPSGESFDACSQGRLLQVCPWEYHMGKRTISREQCLKLNRLVEEIADE